MRDRSRNKLRRTGLSVVEPSAVPVAKSAPAPVPAPVVAPKPAEAPAPPPPVKVKAFVWRSGLRKWSGSILPVDGSAGFFLDGHPRMGDIMVDGNQVMEIQNQVFAGEDGWVKVRRAKRSL